MLTCSFWFPSGVLNRLLPFVAVPVTNCRRRKRSERTSRQRKESKRADFPRAKGSGADFPRAKEAERTYREPKETERTSRELKEAERADLPRTEGSAGKKASRERKRKTLLRLACCGVELQRSADLQARGQLNWRRNDWKRISK
ncbi:hypothetical protein BDL97_16G101800 [Sphagnum fallax]|nr:hypothetical protein BDL97_16G101800 [Sphagnum fallax]